MQRHANRLRLAAAVRVEHNVRGEHAEQWVHVAAVGGLEEPAGGFRAERKRLQASERAQIR